MSLDATRQTFVQEILTHIKPGQVGLAFIDHEAISDVIINSQGQVLCFNTATPEGESPSPADSRKTTLDSLTISTLALILDSFADPDFGVVVAMASLQSDKDSLPAYFQGRFERNGSLVDTVQQQLGH